MNLQKYNLIIDACGAGDIVATAVIDNKSIELLKITDKPFRGEHLLAYLLEALKKHDLSFDNASQLTICRGPGSFMTSRIIATVATGISKQKNIPIFGFRHGDDISTAQFRQLADEPFVPLYE